MSAPRFAASSGGGLVGKVLVLAGLLAFVPILMFAPGGGDEATAADRSASSPAASSRGVDAPEEAGRFPLRTEPAPAGAEPEGGATLIPEQGVERPPGSPPPGL